MSRQAGPWARAIDRSDLKGRPTEQQFWAPPISPATARYLASLPKYRPFSPRDMDTLVDLKK